MKRGSILVAVLLLLSLLLVIGMALLAKEAFHFGAARRTADSEAAFELALAGLEDMRVKALKDLRFPPARDEAQVTFAYTEEVELVGGGDPVGHYQVTVDRRYEIPPYEVWRIEVVGILGEAVNPRARRTITATFDVALDRGGPNPNYFQIIDFSDQGSL